MEPNHIAIVIVFSFFLAFSINILVSINKNNTNGTYLVVQSKISLPNYLQVGQGINVTNDVELMEITDRLSSEIPRNYQLVTTDNFLPAENLTHTIIHQPLSTDQPLSAGQFEDNLHECQPVLSKILKNYNFQEPKTWLEISAKLSGLVEQSSYIKMIQPNFAFLKPESCEPSQCIAVLIPARNRDAHLRQLLFYLPGMLMNQLSCFGIYVLDQFDISTTFNKAKLFNAGILQAKKDKNWDCFVFHDVDLLLKNESILYKCESSGDPLHLSIAVDKYQYRIFRWYETTVGGVSLFNWNAINKTNGWSNEFWGWGGEDTNMYKRVVGSGLKMARPEFKCRNPMNGNSLARNPFFVGDDKHFGFNCASWQMIKHGDDNTNPVNSNRLGLLRTNDWRVDGIGNVVYRLVEKIVKHGGFFNYLLIDVGGIALDEFEEQNRGKAVWKDKGLWKLRGKTST